MASAEPSRSCGRSSMSPRSTVSATSSSRLTPNSRHAPRRCKRSGTGRPPGALRSFSGGHEEVPYAPAAREAVDTQQHSAGFSDAQVDDRRLVHEPVLFINNCDVVDDGPVELRTAMRLMHMPADHQPWLRAADRGEQLAATEVIHAASRGRDLIAIAVRRLVGDEDVDVIRNSSVHGLELVRVLHERPVQEPVGPGSPHISNDPAGASSVGTRTASSTTMNVLSGPCPSSKYSRSCT